MWMGRDLEEEKKMRKNTFPVFHKEDRRSKKEIHMPSAYHHLLTEMSASQSTVPLPALMRLCFHQNQPLHLRH
jgi:hypothetical protein